MRQRLLTSLLLLLALSSTYGAEHHYRVRVQVVNIMGEAIEGAKLSLMSADSVLIDTTSTAKYGWYTFVINKTGQYILKASKEGYEDGYTNFSFRNPRTNMIFPSPIRLIKEARNLPEVVVKASKIKMVMRGDTIVYNADAFNLAEGSMLDALISRLPGVRLNKDGQIFVNGKYVQSLMVNGKDFFSGNPKIALENLPAYTVKNVKVYDKAGVASLITGKDMGDKIFVMDVNLKKEYAVGYMGNAEAGSGTEKRYLAKLFGMKFSDLSRIIGYANLNNLNGNQQIGLNGEWYDQAVADGLQATKTTGVSYQYFLDDLGSGFTSENTMSHTDLDHKRTENSQTFLQESDIYKDYVSNSNGKPTAFRSANSFNLLMRGWYFTEDLNFQYQDSRNESLSSTITTSSSSVLNQLLSMNSNKGADLSVSSFFQGGASLFTVDMLRWGSLFAFKRNTSEDFSLNDVRYEAAGLPGDFRNNFFDRLSQHMETMAYVSYNYRLNERYIQPRYSFDFQYNKTNNLLYRLDKLAERDSSRFDLLPSAAEALAQVLDSRNSFRLREYDHQHHIELHLGGREKWLGKNGLWKIILPLRIVHNNLYYFRENRQEVSKERAFFEPTILVSHIPREKLPVFIDFNASLSSHIPDLAFFASYQDDYDPLNIKMGNPNLKDVHDYDASVKVRKEFDHQSMASLSLEFHQQDNATAYELLADKATGSFTTRPVSVNGNWNAKASVNFAGPVDKRKKLTLDTQTGIRYTHLVDMASAGESREHMRAIVYNWRLDETVSLNFRLSDMYEFKIWVAGKYHAINSHREDFSKINAGEYKVGTAADIRLPGLFHITTDFTMNTRRGYQQEEANKSFYVWNAQIDRAFLKGKILVALRGFDLLHQLSNIEYYVNAQGRTESWHNSIPRYVMLSLAWRFNVNPKKKNS